MSQVHGVLLPAGSSREENPMHLAHPSLLHFLPREQLGDEGGAQLGQRWLCMLCSILKLLRACQRDSKRHVSCGWVSVEGCERVGAVCRWATKLLRVQGLTNVWGCWGSSSVQLGLVWRVMTVDICLHCLPVHGLFMGHNKCELVSQGESANPFL